MSHFTNALPSTVRFLRHSLVPENRCPIPYHTVCMYHIDNLIPSRSVLRQHCLGKLSRTVSHGCAIEKKPVGFLLYSCTQPLTTPGRLRAQWMDVFYFYVHMTCSSTKHTAGLVACPLCACPWLACLPCSISTRRTPDPPSYPNTANSLSKSIPTTAQSVVSSCSAAAHTNAVVKDLLSRPGSSETTQIPWFPVPKAPSMERR